MSSEVDGPTVLQDTSPGSIPARSMALGRYVPRWLRHGLRRLDPGFRLAQEEIRKRDQLIGELYRELASSRGAAERGTAAAAPECWGMSADDLRALGDKGLFIVGNARSGTSILLDCFNLSPEIFLLGEANVFLHHRLADFAGWFNRQHVGFKNRRGKGTYLPPPIAAESGGMAALGRMGAFHRYVGEKIAFGPHGTVQGQSYQEAFFAFHARYFYASKYFLILRVPAESIWSMAKLFPGKSPRECYECWVRSLKVQLDLLHTLPNVYMVLFEDLKAATFAMVNALLGTRIDVGAGILRDDHKRSTLASDRLPAELSSYQSLNDQCTAVYQDVRDAFSPETLTFKATAAKFVSANGGFSAQIQDRLDAILEELKPRPGGVNGSEDDGPPGIGGDRWSELAEPAGLRGWPG
jgi:hypothetical protein